MLVDSKPTAMSTQYTDGMAKWKKSLKPSCTLACTGTHTLRVDFLMKLRKKPQIFGPIIMRVMKVQKWSIVLDNVSNHLAPQLQHLLKCSSNLARGHSLTFQSGGIMGNT